MFTTSKFQAPTDEDGMWSFDHFTSMIKRQREPGKDTPGDLRISYKVSNCFSD